jgi:putative ABC transport system permease protein
LLLQSAITNAGRKKGRLALTLLMLSLAGAMFMTVFNLRQAIQSTLAGEQSRFNHDLGLHLLRPVPIDELENTASAIEGVTGVEGWLLGEANVITGEGSYKSRFQVIAMPVGSTFGHLHILEGEWPGNSQRPVLLNIEALEQLDLETGGPNPLGQALTLKIGPAETDWHIAGSLGRMTTPVAYAGYDDFAAASGLENQANYLAVNLTERSIAGQKAVEQTLVSALEEKGWGVLRTSNRAEEKTAEADSMDILAISLMIIVVLTGLVGGVGLSGTLSINVMERTREIGILRSLGATRKQLWQLVIVEGLVIGLFSLIPAVLLSLPLSLIMNGGMGPALFGFGLPFTFVAAGLIYWTGLVLILSLLATLGPARRAERITIREAIAYS